jgi:uncharacterized cupredoxin-like copper-binding protein
VPRSLSRLLIPLTVTALLGGACSDDGGSPGDGATIDVTLVDDGVTLSETEASSGTLTFDTTNEGTLTHEIEVFEGEKDPASLPIEDHVADTEGWTLIDEIEDITPGASAPLTLDLEPGTYQVVCNLSGHFEKGMYATLTVS